jgi:transcription antitermination factor NusG
MLTAHYDSTRSIAQANPPASDMGIEGDAPHWYALSTMPRNENSVARSLEGIGYEVYLPTYSTVKLWKNRQRVIVELPLFLGYVFLRTRRADRFRALCTTGAVRFVGNSQGPTAIPLTEITFLQSKYCADSFEPYRELVVGQQVRVFRGVLHGIEGVLVRKDNDVRFVMTIKLINQHIAAIVDAADLEPL